METHMTDAMDLIKRAQARREEAGFKVSYMVMDDPGREPRLFTAYAKDAEQAARWQEKGDLAAWYVTTIGYDPFKDDPNTTIEEVRQTKAEYLAELEG
jgi:hypothetical protein